MSPEGSLSVIDQTLYPFDTLGHPQLKSKICGVSLPGVIELSQQHPGWGGGGEGGDTAIYGLYRYAYVPLSLIIF